MIKNNRYFDPDPVVRNLAQELYTSISNLPLVCPHGHVAPRLFADPDYDFGTPVDLLIIPDHYVLRMLYSQGISMENLGVPRTDGTLVESDHRRIWQTFADHFYLFRGTPSGMWLRDELAAIFNVEEKLTPTNAQAIYDQIAARLTDRSFSPRRLYEAFNIEVLCTTDAATDTLDQHQAIQASGWHGRILPTFRPDALVNLDNPWWQEEINRLCDLTGSSIDSYGRYIAALEDRRAFFKSMGASATDHAVLTPYTTELSPRETDIIFQRALQGQTSAEDARRFTGHMMLEMARMSVEDGLVMQIHAGSYRNHNPLVFNRFGPDKGADIPLQTEFTKNLQPLLAKYGNAPNLTLILFTLDETSYARELAPLAGHYPALKLGPPWWFHDSLNGIRRYFDEVMETAGIFNTVGFNDDTRAFPSIPARHDLWRRASANWLAGLVARSIVDMDDALDMAYELAYGLAKRAYKLGEK